MGRITSPIYEMENKKCSKPPTRIGCLMCQKRRKSVDQLTPGPQIQSHSHIPNIQHLDESPVNKKQKVSVKPSIFSVKTMASIYF